MEFKRYLIEAATAAEQPVTGDSFDISVNETLNIESNVVDHQPGSVTITLDERAMNMLEQMGCEFSEELDEGVKDWMKIMALVGLTGYGASAAMDHLSGRNTPLGQALSSAAAEGDQDAAKYLRNLGAYIEASDYGTLRMLNFRYLEEPAANESTVDEATYSDRGAHNMYKASRKDDKEADKVRAQRDKDAAEKNKDQQVDEARMSRKWELDLVQDMGDGYWISAEDHSDDDVRKTAYSVYHLEDPKGLEDQQAFVWRDVGFLRVSPYRVSRDELIAAAKEVIAKDQSSVQSESVVESSHVVNHDTHGAVYAVNGKAKLFMTRSEATNVADDMAAKHKDKTGISVVQGPFTGYFVKMPETTLGETKMPASVVKDKERIRHLTDKEFAAKYGDRSEKELRDMAGRHGYGWDKTTKTGSDHYVRRAIRGKKEESVTEGVSYSNVEYAAGQLMNNLANKQNPPFVDDYMMGQIEDVYAYIAKTPDPAEKTNVLSGVTKNDILASLSAISRLNDEDKASRAVAKKIMNIFQRTDEYIRKVLHRDNVREADKQDFSEQIAEAIKLNSKVRIHDPGKKHHGEEGTVVEFRRGLPGVRPPYYTVDHGGTSTQFTRENIKTIKEEEEAEQIHEEHMSEKDAESLAQKHVNAAKLAKEAGNLKGYDAHAEASNDIRDMILKHTDSPKGIPSGKIRSTAKKLFGESSEHKIKEAEYQGREVKLGKPTSGDVKKFKVYVKDPKTGNVKKVNFGDPNMEIKRDNPERRKNFRARHNCADKTDRTKAGYWSCRMWSSKPVSKII